MRCPCAAENKNIASACVAPSSDVPLAPLSVETCLYQLLRRAAPLALRRSSPSTNAAAAVRVLLPARQAQSARLHGERRSGFRPKIVAVPPRLALALRYP